MKKESESLFMQPSETSIAMDYNTAILYLITEQENIMYISPEALMKNDVGKS